MSSDTLRSQLAQLAKKKAGLEQERAKHLKSAVTAASAAEARGRQAERSSSISSKKSHINAAATQYKKHADESGKAAVLSTKIADLDKQMASKLKSLRSEEDRERRQGDRIRKAHESSADKRRRMEKAHALEMFRLARIDVRHAIIPPPEPEMLRVLYMTASPDFARPLRVDAEVSSVQRAIKSARHRLAMDIKYAPAATQQDLFDRLNFERPHVLHFSGHGEEGALLFDNASVTDPKTDPVTFDVLAAFLSAIDTPPRLLVMNACDSLTGAELLLEAVPIVIGMSDEIEDAAAAIFAVQFYSAIANGQPIGHAFRQGKAAILQMLMSDEQAELPMLIHRDDVDPDAVRLVSSTSG